jgi:hypothetical protein
MLKKKDGTGNWLVFDVMRGMAIDSFEWLYWNTSDDAEVKAYQAVFPTATGFGFNPANNGQLSDGDYIYIAIRRDDQAEVTDATKVFNTTTGLGANPQWKPGFPVDFELYRKRTGTQLFHAGARLTGNKYLRTNDNSVQDSDSDLKWDYQDGFYSHTGFDSTYQAWMWKRAKSYFDIVAYTGTGSVRTIPHSLGTGSVPEMMWIKDRGRTKGWAVYHAALGNTKIANLNDTSPGSIAQNAWNNTSPTASVFTVNTAGTVNTSGQNYIAYLFSSLAGVSKVSSVVHSGTTNVDAGFSNGSRFVLLKRIDAAGDWYIWDSLRSIVSGDDPYLLLNSTAAEVTNTDYIDPYSAGFTITSSFPAGTYIYYAIA